MSYHLLIIDYQHFVMPTASSYIRVLLWKPEAERNWQEPGKSFHWESSWSSYSLETLKQYDFGCFKEKILVNNMMIFCFGENLVLDEPIFSCLFHPQGANALKQRGYRLPIYTGNLENLSAMANDENQLQTLFL